MLAENTPVGCYHYVANPSNRVTTPSGNGHCPRLRRYLPVRPTARRLRTKSPHTAAPMLFFAFVSACAWAGPPLPTLNLPDPKIAEVYRGNWENSLLPSIVPPVPPVAAPANPNEEPNRPWKVDVDGHYPGWYPGVDVKHMAAAYLACAKDLDLVLRAWDLTASSKYLLADGSVRPMTFHNNPHSVVPEATAGDTNVYYPLRLTANIDFLLLGDMIFRFSQDKAWLAENLPAMRKAAAYMEGWMDPEGLIHSDSYDLDQVYREIDGVANASAILAFRKLADLEAVAENSDGRGHYAVVADRVAAAMEKHFWNQESGYYEEHLAYNDLARTGRLREKVTAGVVAEGKDTAPKAVDGIRGTGIDAFGVKIGAAGQHEWVAKGMTTGAWIRVNFKEPTRIDSAILFNRTDPAAQPGERFAEGYLSFSDSTRVDVTFNGLDVSRAVAAFAPREVEWVRFVGTKMQGEGGSDAGLAEILILPAGEHYRKISHGMTDTNFALMAFGIAQGDHAQSVWDYFKAHESAFYTVGDLHAPTWIAEKAETYTPEELNKRAPYKDCVAMARIWRYDALMRHRMGDGAGLYRTIQYANTLYDRPSGGGAGYFAERYGLGRFQPGDEAQYTVAKYTGYPAIYNSYIVQRALLGVDVDVWGTITTDPCVPEAWYKQGFGAEGLGVVKDRDIGFTYHDDRVEGWVSGAAGEQKLRLRLPPGLVGKDCVAHSGESTIQLQADGNLVEFSLPISTTSRIPFTLLSGRNKPVPR